MQFKRYEVKSMQEAMARIKKDLGPDAIILSTKKITEGSPFIEVMAARDDETDIPVNGNTMFCRAEEKQDELVTCLRQEIIELKHNLDKLTRKMSFQQDLIDLKETMNVLFDKFSTQYPAHMQKIYMTLMTNGIPRAKAIKLVETMKADFPCEDTDTYEKGIAITEKLIIRSLVKDNQKGRRIKALIGPTGVGKTTTLAKLAAHYSLEKKMKVGLITMDTFRIAAAEQLRVYSKIIGLPLQVASDKDVFLKALDTFADKDVILVDTPGRNHNDERSLKSLKIVLSANVEALLLLSPIASTEYLKETADRFNMFNYDRIILTKVDECNNFGSLYSVVDELGKPISYMTTGQNVPRDIEKANPERLAKLILHNRLN